MSIYCRRAPDTIVSFALGKARACDCAGSVCLLTPTTLGLNPRDERTHVERINPTPDSPVANFNAGEPVLTPGGIPPRAEPLHAVEPEPEQDPDPPPDEE